MIRITEVGPRDGLQNEEEIVPTERKIAFVDALAETGVDEIEVTSFVHPKWVPQLADAEEVFAGIERREGVRYSALVPNLRGFERALPHRPDQVAIFTTASETFSQKNVNTSIDGAFQRFGAVMELAEREGIPVRGYISTAWWCPYEGEIPVDAAVAVAVRLSDIGCPVIALGDTIGKASPAEVRRLLDALLPHIDPDRLVMHFHDTYGHAAANILASWKMGIERFDSSAGGLGGCPFAPDSKGNVATSTVVGVLREAGALVPVDLEALGRARAVLGPVGDKRV